MRALDEGAWDHPAQGYNMISNNLLRSGDISLIQERFNVTLRRPCPDVDHELCERSINTTLTVRQRI
jgi:hypothetical protein